MLPYHKYLIAKNEAHLLSWPQLQKNKSINYNITNRVIKPEAFNQDLLIFNMI